MTTAAQHTAPEDIMALLDGELSAAEARPIEVHIAECAECAAVADQFRETSHLLADWTVAPAPPSLDAAIEEKLGRVATQRAAKIPTRIHLASGHGRRWALAGGAAVTVLFLFAIFYSQPMYKRDPQRMTAFAPPAALNELAARDPHPTAMTMAPSQASIAGVDAKGYAEPAQRLAGGRSNASLENSGGAASSSSSAPMIARTVALNIMVKDIARARPALDAILARYQGYAAELNINTPENYARSFGASLRIPAPALSSALADLRGLGRLQSESQSGEEVTQQHADLVARLKNARETEQRLLAILQQRTGKVSEVLEVEEQISTTRGDIERMEAEQKALEHRVDFATVQLQLTEEYTAQLAPPSTSVGTRMHNSFVAGLANAGNSLLGILLFFEEYGPVLLVWLVVLGTPVVLLWRRYRRAQAQI